MSTPAINTDSHGYVTGTTQSFWANGDPIGPALEQPNRVSARVVDQRPASTNNPRDSLGWRRPSNWYRRGYRCNPYLIGVLKFWDPSMTFYTLYSDGSGWDGWGDSPVGSVPSDVVAKATNKALSKLKNQKVNLGQMFTEREETAKLVLSTVKRITDLTRAYKNKNLKDWVRAQTLGVPGKSGGFPESFLEYRYGVLPLMQDSYGAMEALNQKELGSDGKYRIHVSGRAGLNIQDTYFKPTAVSGYVGIRASSVRTYKCLVNLFYFLDNPLMATLAQLGILNLPSLVWERVPFSFVADWFAPVGPYLGLMDAAVGYQFDSGTLSTLVRETDRGFFSILPGAPAYLQATTYLGSEWYYRGFSMNRATYDTSPFPLWEGFKNPLPKNGEHLQNAIALLSSIYRSKTRSDYA